MAYTPTPGSKSAIAIEFVMKSSRPVTCHEIENAAGLKPDHVAGALKKAVKAGMLQPCYDDAGRRCYRVKAYPIPQSLIKSC
jgi:hypothetical protein